jgi:hypothetical protein
MEILGKYVDRLLDFVPAKPEAPRRVEPFAGGAGGGRGSTWQRTAKKATIRLSTKARFRRR